MRVCTAQQMAAIDRETIAGGLSGSELMERAGTAMSEIVQDFLGHETTEGGALVICGKGNNGGDGLVVARLLQLEGVPVTVLLLANPEVLAETAREKFQLLPPEVHLVVAEDSELWPDLLATHADQAGVLVDALFGTGIKPPLRSPYADLIRAVNDLGMSCVGLDIPSGVNGDTGAVDPVAVACDLTITVQMPKLGLLLAPGRDFVGDIEVIDIGFPREVCDRYAPDHHYLEEDQYAALLPARPSSTYKYRCGKLLLVAGSRRFGGAAHLAALGSLRAGTGLVTLAGPQSLETPLRAALPEILVRPLAETPDGTIMPPAAPVWESLIAGQSAVAVGPGLDADSATDAWVTRMQGECSLPLIVDADGLNAWSRLGLAPHFAHAQVVLTPHPGEMARLLATTTEAVEADRFAAAQQAATTWQVVVLLKGSPSLIALPDGRVFINPTGDDALARAGSGDVLTGLIGGLLAQGSSAMAATLLGAYIHGKAGTLSARGRSTRGVLVSETAAAIGPVFEELEQIASGDAALREAIWPTSRDLPGATS